jgi:transcription initiation factor IIE alpha subunit
MFAGPVVFFSHTKLTTRVMRLEGITTSRVNDIIFILYLSDHVHARRRRDPFTSVDTTVEKE